MFTIDLLKLCRTFYKLGLVLFLSIIIGLLIGTSRSNAISDPALNSLRSEVNGLRIRIDRLETEIRNLKQVSRRNLPTNRYNPPPISLDRDRSRRIESEDPMFQSLATLVIELKQEINKLEERLKKVEDLVN